jgi:phosphatidylglycerophosphate synthase
LSSPTVRDYMFFMLLLIFLGESRSVIRIPRFVIYGIFVLIIIVYYVHRLSDFKEEQKLGSLKSKAACYFALGIVIFVYCLVGEPNSIIITVFFAILAFMEGIDQHFNYKEEQRKKMDSKLESR